MATLLATNAIPLPQITIGFAAIGATLTFVGSFTQAIELMTIVSTLNQPVALSFDGVNIHATIPPGSTSTSITQYNFKGNLIVLPVYNCSVYAEQTGGTAPTAGNLYINAFSAANP
jgi:hypothetical protein